KEGPAWSAAPSGRPAERVHRHDHECVHHVRLLGTVHLDSRIPFSSCRSGRPRFGIDGDNDVAAGGGRWKVVWLRVVRIYGGSDWSSANLRRIPGDCFAARAVLRPDYQSGCFADPRTVGRVLRHGILRGFRHDHFGDISYGSPRYGDG